MLSLLVFLCIISALFAQIPDGCFDLTKATALTFYKGQMTTGKRSAPRNQLNCIGGNACDQSSIINAVQCTNTGVDGYGAVQIKCETQLPTNLVLSNTKVICEGCTASGDFHKLLGSCGLLYSLDDTNKNSNNDNNNTNYYSDGDGVLLFIFLVIIVVTIAFCIFYICNDFTMSNSRSSYTCLPIAQSVPFSSNVNTTSYYPQTSTTTYSQSSAPPYNPSYSSLYGSNRQSNGNTFTGMLIGENMTRREAENAYMMSTITGQTDTAQGIMLGNMMHHKKNHHGNHHNNSSSNNSKQTYTAISYGAVDTI